MNTQEICQYLGRLLGRQIAADDLVTLSSGQRARLSGWLAERGISAARSRTILGTAFRPTMISGDNAVETRDAMHTAPVPLPSRSTTSIEAALQIGIDIQYIDELFKADAKTDLKANAEFRHMFTLREISYAQSRPQPLETLAGLFAAKEALRKCSPPLLHRPLPELEVLPDALGKPEFPGYALSISHSGGLAIAVAATLSEPPSRNEMALSKETSLGATPAREEPLRSEPSGRLKAAILTAAIVLTFVLLSGGVLHSFGVGR